MRLFKKKEQGKKKTWNDLTIEDLLKIKNINTLQMATEDEKNLKVAALVAGIPYEEIIQVPLDKVREYIDEAEFLLSPPKPIKAKNNYTVNGRKYTLLKNEMELLTSQYIDLQAIYQDGFEKRPAELLSVMMVPKGHTYNDGYDKDQVIEDMYKMHVEEALGIVDFFTQRFLKSIEWVRMFLKWRIRLARILAPKKEKEMYRAMEIQMNLTLDVLNSMSGWIASKQ